MPLLRLQFLWSEMEDGSNENKRINDETLTTQSEESRSNLDGTMEGKALEKKGSIEAPEEKSSKIAEQLPNNTGAISSATLSIEESPSKLDDNMKSDTLEKKDFKEAPEEKSFKIAEKNEQLPNNIDVPATSSGNSPKAVESDNKNSQSKLDGTTEGKTIEGEKTEKRNPLNFLRRTRNPK